VLPPSSRHKNPVTHEFYIIISFKFLSYIDSLCGPKYLKESTRKGEVVSVPKKVSYINSVCLIIDRAGN
jgi:hypothetical protein